MIQQPRLKAHFYAETVPGEGTFLISESGPIKLAGRMFECLVPLLDGRLMTNEIVNLLKAEGSPAKIYYALTLLEQQGYIEEAPNDQEEKLSTGEEVFWAFKGVDPGTGASRRATTTISVTSLASVDVEPFLQLLKSMHVQVSEVGQLGVVLTDDFLRGELETFNEEALKSGRKWILIKPVGQEIWIGPIFNPSVTGCWTCLAQRIRGHREIEGVVQRNLNRTELFPIPRAETAATRQLAYGMAATRIAEWISRGDLPELEGQVLSLDLQSWETRIHKLVRQPYCSACGDASILSEDAVKPVVLQSCRKVFTSDGGHRAFLPEETLKRYENQISSITGIISELRRCDMPEDGIVNVYIAGDNRAIQNWSSDILRVHFRSKSAGKGVTEAQAKASGLCEAIERYSGYFQGYEPRRRARLEKLGAVAIHPYRCMEFSEKQYRDRVIWNARRSRFNNVPVPFDEEEEVEWTPIWSMTNQCMRYLPTGFCFYAYPMTPEKMYFRADSNGNAAGNTLEEAILQGFLELVERDAMGIWWYNRIRRPAVDISSFEDKYLDKLRSFLDRHDRDLWALDLTNDLQIPVFGAFSRYTKGPHDRIIMGFGAHLDPAIALRRAVTEMNQMLTWVVPEERKANSEPILKDGETIMWLKTATLENQPYLTPQSNVSLRRANDFRFDKTEDIKDDVLACQALVERLDFEMLVLDQTRPDIGMPVVKVIIPGLRHCHARLAPGRLYKAPVSLGWLSAPLTEEELNPIPIFL
jgi:oxazoline/thiazoline synthase